MVAVEVDPAPDASFGLWSGLRCVQIDAFILQRSSMKMMSSQRPLPSIVIRVPTLFWPIGSGAGWEL